jgi:hypothetical protein
MALTTDQAQVILKEIYNITNDNTTAKTPIQKVQAIVGSLRPHLYESVQDINVNIPDPKKYPDSDPVPSRKTPDLPTVPGDKKRKREES